jgi:hypothetical protein
MSGFIINPYAFGPPPATGIKAGLLHWWDLEESSGSRADAHGSKPLSPAGTVTAVAAKNGNGSSTTAGSYLQSIGSTSLHAGDFTIAGVFKTTQSSSGIISRNGPIAGSQRQFLITLDTGGTFYFTVSTDGAVNAATIGIGSALNDNGLHTYICWRDTVASLIYAQVDGGTPASASMTGATPLYSASDPGFTLHGIGAGTFVAGSVCDSTGIWNRMLTSTERTDLYNGGAWRDYAGLASI